MIFVALPFADKDGMAERSFRANVVVEATECFEETDDRGQTGVVQVLEGVRMRHSIGIDGEVRFASLLVLVLAEVFRSGTEMREDQNLTV